MGISQQRIGVALFSKANFRVTEVYTVARLRFSRVHSQEQRLVGSDSPEIGVTRDDNVSSTARTNNDVGIDDVGRRGSRR
jgi:hypothetical protein